MYDEVLSDTRSNDLAARSAVLLRSLGHGSHELPQDGFDLHAGVSGDARPTASALAAGAANGEIIDSISALIEAVTHALAGESERARRSIQMAGLSLARGLADNRPIPRTSPAMGTFPCRGGLAPWQVRRLTMHIENHLAESLQCEDLARLVGLSLSHFMRAFRESFGCPPHAYLMRRRMEYAQGLMLTTNTPLGQIALECGLADQSHLSRLFQKFVGETPAAWRRARVQNAAQ
jgi:AraC-like DNA-binding protein